MFSLIDYNHVRQTQKRAMESIIDIGFVWLRHRILPRLCH